jgi:hypothetical protein
MMADAGFVFSALVLAGLVTGLLAVSHLGARQVASRKAQRATVANARLEEEPEFPFDDRDREPAPEVRPSFAKQFEKHT